MRAPLLNDTFKMLKFKCSNHQSQIITERSLAHSTDADESDDSIGAESSRRRKRHPLSERARIIGRLPVRRNCNPSRLPDAQKSQPCGPGRTVLGQFALAAFSLPCPV
jgi:hypothetical protein